MMAAVQAARKRSGMERFRMQTYECCCSARSSRAITSIGLPAPSESEYRYHVRADGGRLVMPAKRQPVHGLAFGVPLSKAGVGPLAQFQNCNNDTDSIMKLVVQLVQRLPNAEPDRDMVRAQVEIFRSQTESILAQRVADADADADADELEYDEASTASCSRRSRSCSKTCPHE
jgi:hypothetical protein